MNPFYKDEASTLYLGDCVTGMSSLPEGLFNLIVTSPPYNIGKEYEKEVDFGQYLNLLWGFLYQGHRVIKKGGYCVVNAAPYYSGFSGENTLFHPMEIVYHIIAERAGWAHQTTRIWHKDFATLDDKYTINTTLPKLEWEYLMVFRKPGGGREKVREQNLHPRAIWDTTGHRQRNSTLNRHPAAFPEILISWIIQVYSDEGDVVIDPFAGSATTLLVAKKLKRRSIGYELNEEYATMARLLLSQQVLEPPPAAATKPEQLDML